MEVSNPNLEVLELFRQGASVAEICCRLDMPYDVVYRAARQLANLIHGRTMDPIPEGYMHINDAAAILKIRVREIQDYRLAGMHSILWNGLRCVRLKDVQNHLATRRKYSAERRVERKLRKRFIN